MKPRQSGFTLAEMAIVLVVIGLLLTSVLSTVSTQLEARNTGETAGSGADNLLRAVWIFIFMLSELGDNANSQQQHGQTFHKSLVRPISSKQMAPYSY